MERCYNCGIEISKKEGTLTREHIPAQNLYAGYDEKYKNNRIVVPSCAACNNGSNKVDEEFRNLIGTISDEGQLDVISEKTAKSIVTRNKQYNRLTMDNLGHVRGVSFDKVMINDNHIKIFKGLFYHQYGIPLPDNYKVMATFDPTENTGSMVKYLQENFEWKASGHPDVFEYILQPFREGLVNPDKLDLVPVDQEPFYLGLLSYNKSHAAVVIATNREIKPPSQS